MFRHFQVWLAFLVVAGLACVPASNVVAANAKFMGVPIETLSGTYEVTTHANVRARPETKGKRLGGLRKGARIEVAGKVGGWFAVRRSGKDLGFVYKSLLKMVSLPPVEKDAQGRILDADGQPIAPASGFFLSSSDVNLRVKPTTKAQKRGRLERGSRVEAIGAADNGNWLVVRRGKQELGFVFTETLLPLVDGALDAPLAGDVKIGADKSCRFVIRFVGKNSVEGELFETSDYEVDWECEKGGKKVAFPGYMFITEAPFQLSDNGIYQINIDLPNVTREYDEVFSTIFLYRRDEKKVVLDSVSMKEYALEPGVDESPAGTVREALVAASKMAPLIWNADVWGMLADTASN